MHILVTADTIGGVWTYTRELVTGLAQRGVGVTLVSFGNIPVSGQLEWMEGLPDLDFRPTAFKLEWMQESEADLAASAEYLQSVIRETRPDLLHLNQFYYGALPCDVPRIVVAHSDVVSWWVAVHREEPPDSPWIRWYRHNVTRGLSSATAVIAPSRWMLDQVCRYYTNPRLRSVIHNGRTPALFNPYLDKDHLIVTVGRLWDRGKNAALLLQRDMPAPVSIAGSRDHPQSEPGAFAGLEPRLGVHLEPQLEEKQLIRLMARAGIYAATSCYEPFGLAPVEAALCRCALVASDIPAFRELWDGAALFFRSNDSESLFQKLEEMLRDPAMRREYANRAYDRARQRFCAGRMVRDYLNLYESLASTAALTA
jgi:glycogen(starch) synthase